jgi:hypothetical protein
MEGSKPTHGKGNRVLHPEPLSEKSGVGSPAKAREGNRVLHASKEVGIAYGSVRWLGHLARREKRTQRSGAAAIHVLGDLQEASVRIDIDDRPRFLLRFLGAGVDYLPGADRVRHLRKVSHIRGGIGIEHYDIGVHSLLDPPFIRRL